MNLPKKIALFLPTLGGGGAERVFVNLATEFANLGHSVDLVVARPGGSLRGSVPPSVRVVDLGVKRVLQALRPLARYLTAYRPDVLLSAMEHANAIAFASRFVSRHSSLRLICTTHNVMSNATGTTKDRLLQKLSALVYRRVEGVVAVSEGVAADVSAHTGLSRQRITVIYNPVLSERLQESARGPVDHPFLVNRDLPVVLATGRLTEQKDYETLLRAVAIARASRPLRLLILGEGEQRRSLEAFAASLGIKDHVSMPGFTANPYAYMCAADVFALSSRWEGLPTVLIEALGLGCKIVSTDCPSGPSEILDNGRFGELVRVGDANGLAAAIVRSLDSPTSTPPASWLEQFTAHFCAGEYLRLMDAPRVQP